MDTFHNRRDFIKKAGLGAFGLIAATELLKSSRLITHNNAVTDKMAVGLQLYTVRDNMNADVVGTLKEVAKIGYTQLELAGYNEGKFYGYLPGEFRKILNDLGLEVVSSHTGVEVSGINMNNANAMAEAHAELGVRYCVQPWIIEERRTSIDSYKKLVDLFNSVGKIMKQYDLQFGYHNHNFEFDTVEGQVPFYDVFMKDADPDFLTFELDIYWVVKAKQDPVKIINDYPGRFQLWHVKDMDHSSEGFFAPVGTGIIDFREIFKFKEKAGMMHYFVEQDATHFETPMDCIKISYNNLVGKIL